MANKETKQDEALNPDIPTAEQSLVVEIEAEAAAKAAADKAAAKAAADKAAAKAAADKAAKDQQEAEETAKAEAAKAQAEADAEAVRLAEEAEKAKQLDMSLHARKGRAQAALNEALEAQAEINAIVTSRTKDLDALIVEESSLVDKNPMAEIRFYLNRQQRKREEKAEQRAKMLERGMDPMELVKSLDTRAPIDQKGGSGRKHDPRSVRPPVAK